MKLSWILLLSIPLLLVACKEQKRLPPKDVPPPQTEPSAPVLTRIENAGTIRGRVTFSGQTPPAPAYIPVSRDADHCVPVEGKTLEGLPVVERRLAQIDPETKGIGDVWVSLVSVQAGKRFVPLEVDATLQPEPAEGLVLRQKNCAYEPHLMLVPVGSRLTIRSDDPIPHSVNATATTGPTFHLAFTQAGQQYSNEKTVIRKSHKNVITLSCKLGHHQMRAFVIPQHHVFSVLTNEKGEYTFSDVPPGTYKVQFWHEGWAVRHLVERKSTGTPMVTAVTYERPVKQRALVQVKPEKETTLDFAFDR